MPAITLPPKYYLTHFFEFIDFIESHYAHILQFEQRHFLADFRSLGEEAQCVYIRMINRKGRLFEKKSFAKYAEINNFNTALSELVLNGFVESVSASEISDLLTFLTKGRLRKWLQCHNLDVAISLSRDEMVNLGKQNLHLLNHLHVDGHEDLMVQGHSQTMQFLLFIYFGHIQKSLTLYTLRDLGIRQSQTLKSDFKPRFLNLAQAEAEYFFAQNLDESLCYHSVELLNGIYEKAVSYENISVSTQLLKDDLLFQLAVTYSGLSENEMALKSYDESQHPEARREMARLLYKMDRRPECLILLEKIQNDPRNDEELLFAEDFSARKFNKQKRGRLTEVLLNSNEIVVSDFYLKRPELGVCKHFEAQGFRADFTENFLWTGLFGILFWDELFEAAEAAFHNPFERSPSDLVGPEFYRRHAPALEAKLTLLKNPEKMQHLILQTVITNAGRLNDVFQWHPDLAESLIHFTKNSVDQDVALVLRTMAQKYDTHHTGFPDLMIEKDGRIRFVEVKAEGDSLRAAQLSRLRLLKEAGFEVEVLRVRWMTDPNQTYVVVDVETTGGSASFHRVTEVGAVKIKNGRMIEEFQTLINPGRPIPSFITGITGITDEMVADAPAFSDIAEKLLDFMDGSVFVAHNVKFDYGFIQREFQKAGIEFTRAHLCTCAGMRKTHPGLKSYGLKSLTEHFQINLDQHHRALSDARAAAELLLLMNGKRTEL